MIDKNFCMSSYLAFRYIEDDNMNFFEGLRHENIKPIDEDKKILVSTSDDIDREIQKQIDKFKGIRKGILLSGGMDSAIVASYLSGSDAYTFRYLGGEFQKEELERAEYYAKCYGLKLHYVDINWNIVCNNLNDIMKHKCAPVHSIEPQIYQAAVQAKKDGIQVMFVGASSDLIFGGMDQLLSKDWSYSEFVSRYTFTKPEYVLKNPISMNYLFKRYKENIDKINFLKFMQDVSLIECSSSYFNAFNTAKLDYCDPYAILKMANPLDLNKVRDGKSKYLIRDLMKKKYPDIPVPDKIPMPRPVDYYFKDWKGPVREEFRNDIDMDSFTGNQKWQMYCLESFLNLYDPK